MVSKLKSLLRYKEYIVLLAYGIVLGDVLDLLKEVATEYLMHKRFNQLVQRHVEETSEITENDVEQTSEFENSLTKVENFSEQVIFTNETENITKVEIE